MPSADSENSVPGSALADQGEGVLLVVPLAELPEHDAARGARGDGERAVRLEEPAVHVPKWCFT